VGYQGVYYHLGRFINEDDAGEAARAFFVERGVEYPMPN
jgi:hypothetical protein